MNNVITNLQKWNAETMCEMIRLIYGKTKFGVYLAGHLEDKTTNLIRN